MKPDWSPTGTLTPPPAVPVDGEQMIAEVEGFIRKYCVLPDEHSYVAVALWAVHTHTFLAFDTTGRLAILSAEMSSGKTRVLEVLQRLCFDSVHIMNASTAYVFRRIAVGQPTLLVDETDALFASNRGGKLDPSKDEIRGVINAGYRKGAVVGRAEAQGKQIVTVDYPVFCPVALAGIKALPDTLMSRSIVIWMQRRKPNEPVAAFRERKVAQETQPIRALLSRWAHENTDEIRRMLEDEEVELPEGIDDRKGDVWEPLLAVADRIGGDWPKRAREAALHFVEAHEDNTSTTGTELLRDIKKVFGENLAMPSETLCAWLQADEDTMWDERLTVRKLANKLKPFGITPAPIRFADGVRRGYFRADFQDVWERYA